MGRWVDFILVLACVATMVPGAGLAAIPDFMTYSGRLTDGSAWGKSTTVDLTFRIYDCGCAPDGPCDVPCKEWPGTPLKEQTFKSAPVEDGFFNVVLTGVSGIFSAHDQTWLTVCVGTPCLPGDDLLPGQAVGSVPYAVRAEDAAAVDGRPGNTIADMKAAEFFALGATALAFCNAAIEIPTATRTG